MALKQLINGMKIGDKVILPNNGEGVVTEIRELPWGFPISVRITKQSTLYDENTIEDFREDQIEMMKDFEYIGLFLTPSSRKALLKTVPELVGQRIFLDHCTLLHRSKMDNPMAEAVLRAFENNEGNTFNISITHVGWNSKAVAFRCHPSWLPCTNKNPHITIATFEGGKPVDSNSITTWLELKTIIVQATLEKR